MIDEIDRRVAAILQGNNQKSAEAIGSEVGLSVSAVQRRLARLRREGLIAADVSVLDAKAFGIGMTFVVEIALEKVRVAEVQEIKDRLRAAPEIQQIYNITGDADLLLIVLARDIEHFEEISRENFSADPLIRRYKTSVVMHRVKATLAIPL